MLDALVVIFGITLVFGGVRAVRRRQVTYDYGEAEGGKAVSIGYLWIVLGILAILGVVFDIGVLRDFLNLFLTSGG
jgi:hypothetical protein